MRTSLSLFPQIFWYDVVPVGLCGDCIAAISLARRIEQVAVPYTFIEVYG